MSHTRRQYLRRAAGSVGATVALTGCLGGGENWNRTIGLPIPLSGPLGALGRRLRQSSQIVVDEFNSSSDSEDISLTVEDIGGGVSQARTVVQGMIDDDVPAMMGTISSDVALAVRELVEEEEVPILSPLAGNTGLTQPGTRFFFRYPNADMAQKPIGGLQYLQSEGVSTVSFIGADYTYPRNFMSNFKANLGEYDVSVETEAYVPLGTTNFRGEIGEISADVDAILLIYPGANGITLIQQLRQAGKFEDPLVVGDDSYATNAYRDNLGEDVLGLRTYGGDMNSQVATRLAQTVSDRFDIRADIYHVFAYDAIRTVVNGVATAESTTPGAIRDAISSTTWSKAQTASGIPLKFNENGLNATFVAIMMEWQRQNGAISTVPIWESETINPQS